MYSLCDVDGLDDIMYGGSNEERCCRDTELISLLPRSFHSGSNRVYSLIQTLRRERGASTKAQAAVSLSFYNKDAALFTKLLARITASTVHEHINLREIIT